MIEAKQARFTIHSLHLQQLAQQDSPSKKGIRRQVKTTLKRQISNNESLQRQIQITSNLLNKERSGNSVQIKKSSQGKIVKMNNILLNLPEIVHSSMRTEVDDEDQKKEDLPSYSSIKLNNLRDKYAQNVKERYYKKIQIMKEIKAPIISKQIFPISQISNNTLNSFTKQPNYATQALRLNNKKSLTNITLDKYQIVRQKQDIQIPRQLEARKFNTRYNFNTIPVQSKNSIRFKFDQMLSKEKRSFKKMPEKVAKIEIKGWQSDHQIGLQHNFMFD